MKLAFLTGEYPPMQGGIADYTANLATHLSQQQIKPAIMISRRWLTIRQRWLKQQAVADSPNTASHSIKPYLLPDWGWRCWLYIGHYLNYYQPDILHIQYQAAMYDLGGWVNWLPWYLKLRRWPIKIITTYHDLRIPYIFPKAGSLRWSSVLALARYSDAVICTNREDWQILSQHVGQLTGDHIPLGSNLDPQPPDGFNRQVWRQQYQADENCLLLAHFGFLNESKGAAELIISVATLRQQGLDVRLVFVGADIGDADPTNVAYANRVRQLIGDHQLEPVIHFTGYIDSAGVSANLLAADAVVLPYQDGVSFRRTTLIVALRHGCPVVSTQPTAPTLVPEIRPGENMLLAPPNDPASLARTIATLNHNHTLRHQLSAGSKQLGQLFEWPHIATKTVALYRKVLTWNN